MLVARKPGEAAVGGGAAGNGSVIPAALVETATAPLKVFEQIGRIVNSTTAVPTIVNEASNFVVVTYWWGRGNMNNNFARPCIAFYEELLMRPVYLIKSSVKLSPEVLRGEIDWLALFLSPKL